MSTPELCQLLQLVTVWAYSTPEVQNFVIWTQRSQLGFREFYSIRFKHFMIDCRMPEFYWTIHWSDLRELRKQILGCISSSLIALWVCNYNVFDLCVCVEPQYTIVQCNLCWWMLANNQIIMNYSYLTQAGFGIL